MIFGNPLLRLFVGSWRDSVDISFYCFGSRTGERRTGECGCCLRHFFPSLLSFFWGSAIFMSFCFCLWRRAVAAYAYLTHALPVPTCPCPCHALSCLALSCLGWVAHDHDDGKSGCLGNLGVLIYEEGRGKLLSPKAIADGRYTR